MERPIAEASTASLARRLVTAPQRCAAAAVQARVARWLDEIERSAAGAELQRALAEHPAAHALVAGIAEHSPYLWDLVHADPDRLLTLLQSDPDTRLDVIIAVGTAAA